MQACGAPATQKTKPLTRDRFETLLAVGAIALFTAMVTAIARGAGEWGQVPGLVWAHLATIATALLLTPVMLLRKRGDRWHRQLGWAWAGAMVLTVAISLMIRLSNNGGISIIHILSVWTLIQVPLLVYAARTHNIGLHRGAVRGMVLGALLIAGFFTFPFDRLLGHWLFS